MGSRRGSSVQHVLLFPWLSPLLALTNCGFPSLTVRSWLSVALHPLLFVHGMKEVNKDITMAEAIQPTSARQLNTFQRQELLTTISSLLESLSVLHRSEVPVHTFTHTPALRKPTLFQSAPGCSMPNVKGTSRKDFVKVQRNSPGRDPCFWRVDAEANCLQSVQSGFSKHPSGSMLIRHYRELAPAGRAKDSATSRCPHQRRASTLTINMMYFGPVLQAYAQRRLTFRTADQPKSITGKLTAANPSRRASKTHLHRGPV